MANNICYSIPEVCGENRYCLKLAGQVDVTRPFEQVSIAEKCANDFFYKHGGQDCSWPLDINLFREEESELLATINVDMDMLPTFTGHRKIKDD